MRRAIFGVCVAWASTAPASGLTLVSYTTQGVSGNAAAWSGVASGDVLALPAVRGAGLGLGGGLNQFTSTAIATTPQLDLALNDYVRFGFTLRQDAGAEFAVTGFRSTFGRFGAGSVGMQYQVWGFFTDQAPFAITPAEPVESTTLVDALSLPANAVVFPGQTAEIRVYFWGASGTQNGVAFISDGNASTADTEIRGIPVPAPPIAAAALLAAAARARPRRR